ncbi:hypothetical protein [Candidatus Methanoprimaticola sp. MG2]|uniref:hypothetical protein n=1 Tax=Candidatus Methanoprimaticola sp. MG2 TaxID=3228838 RepID=UPI0039C69434
MATIIRIQDRQAIRDTVLAGGSADEVPYTEYRHETMNPQKAFRFAHFIYSAGKVKGVVVGAPVMDVDGDDVILTFKCDCTIDMSRERTPRAKTATVDPLAVE